jgi:hypothetical protein
MHARETAVWIAITTSRNTAALVAQALEDFRKGMEYREQLNIRGGRRTMQKHPLRDNQAVDSGADPLLPGLYPDQGLLQNHLAHD